MARFSVFSWFLEFGWLSVFGFTSRTFPASLPWCSFLKYLGGALILSVPNARTTSDKPSCICISAIFIAYLDFRTFLAAESKAGSPCLDQAKAHFLHGNHVSHFLNSKGQYSYFLHHLQQLHQISQAVFAYPHYLSLVNQTHIDGELYS